MANWVYEARDRAGKVVQGAHEAPDRRTALEFLRGQGLFLTRLEATRGGLSKPSSKTAPITSVAVASAPGTRPPVEVPLPESPRPGEKTPPVQIPQPLPRPISTGANPGVQTPRVASVPIAPQPLLHSSAKDLSIFFRQTGAMLHAGTTIGAAMNSMSENAPNAALRKAAAHMEKRVMSGEPMSESMRSFPGLFSPLQIGMVSAGERGGFLVAIFERLTKYAERDYELQQTIKKETWYPKLLVLASIFIPAAVPLVLAMVQGGQNPFFAWFRQVAPPMVLIGLAYAIYRAAEYTSPLASHQSAIKSVLDDIKLRAPVMGKVTKALATAKFCRALGALTSAGVGVGESVRLASGACGNTTIARGALEAIPRLESGEKLTESLAKSGHFPKMVLQMLKVGEDSGSIDDQLDKAADFLESDAEVAIKQSIQVLGIVVFLIIAIRIGIIIGGFYTSYFDNIFKMAEG
jgi:type II secretory pathway component PulF